MLSFIRLCNSMRQSSVTSSLCRIIVIYGLQFGDDNLGSVVDAV
jgi:hypothetical protein